MDKKIKLSLIVPCYNEENNVFEFHNAVKNAFRDETYLYEILYIDDGSSDNTYKNLGDIWSSEKKRVSVIRFSRNFGKEAAIYAGLQYANGSYVTIIDSDLQQQPEIVVEMVKILDDSPSYDCVCAYQKKRIEGTFMSLLKKGFYYIFNKISDTEFHTNASDFRTFRYEMVNAILSMGEYYRFSKGIFSWIGFNTHYIPYIPEKRKAGTSKWSVRKLFNYAKEGILSFTTFPLKIAIYLGATSSLIALAYMFIVIVQKLFFSIEIPGYTTIVVLILLLGGCQLFIQGIIGEYLARVYIQGKNRPIFIAKEILKNEGIISTKGEERVQMDRLP